MLLREDELMLLAQNEQKPSRLHKLLAALRRCGSSLRYLKMFV